MRPPAAMAYRMLEWGTATSSPGSQVLDADGNMIFTGSDVESLNIPEQCGTVAKLHSPTAVEVDWPDDTQPIQACQLRVLRGPART